MMIKEFTIRNFGPIGSARVQLAPVLNRILCPCTEAFSDVLQLLLCSKDPEEIPAHYLQENTHISARICLDGRNYRVRIRPCEGRLQMSVTDSEGADVTAFYQYVLRHCPEQDDLESFNGQDRSLPMRLYQYRNWEDMEDLPERTRHMADTQTFQSCLQKYIADYRPEPINSKKDYRVEIDDRGNFRVVHPEITGRVFLSETEEKLFLYTCFLNIAEFWCSVQKLRDLHHEKKPLIIQNLLDRMDASVNITGLTDRTVRLQRQIIHLDATQKGA